MKNIVFVVICFMCFPSSTFAVELDGSLPMYPRGKNMNDMPAAAIAKGVPLVLQTEDSVQTVDAWYASNAPKSCTRSAEKQGVKYACPGGSVMIYSKGKTQIALIPPMGSMFGH